MSAEYEMVILDEINYAISYRMLDAERVLEGWGKSRKWSM